MMDIRELDITPKESSTPDSLLKSRIKRSTAKERLSKSFHSTQSITGRASLLTYEHEQYQSASASLDAYIRGFEEEHPLATTQFQKSVEHLLLPQSMLARTVDRSLQTGVRDTPAEWHRFNMRKLVDESYEEICRLHSKDDKDKHFGRLPDSSTPVIPSDTSSLPGPVDDEVLKNLKPKHRSTPSVKRTAVPARQNAFMSEFLKKDTGYRSNHLEDLRSLPLFDTLSYKVDFRSKLSSLAHKPQLLLGDIPNRNNEDTLGQSLGMFEGSSNISFISGGKAPPSWIGDLENSTISKAGDLNSMKRRKGNDDSQVSIERRRPNSLKPSLNETNCEITSVDGVDENAVMREVDRILRERLISRRVKNANVRKLMQKEEGKLSDGYANGFIASGGRRRTESVTTDDLVTASPYGLSVDSRFHSSKRNPLSRHVYDQPKQLPGPHSSKVHFYSSLPNSGKRRQNSNGELTPMKSLPMNPRRDRILQQHKKPFTSQNQKEYSLHEASLQWRDDDTYTDSLVQESSFGVRTMDKTTSNFGSTLLSHPVSPVGRSSKSEGSTRLTGEDAATIGSVGDSSKIAAIISRARRVVDEKPRHGATGEVGRAQRHWTPRMKQTLDVHGEESSSGSMVIINKFLDDCLQATRHVEGLSSKERPLETLKNMLFTLQSMEDSQPKVTEEQNVEHEMNHPSKKSAVKGASIRSPQNVNSYTSTTPDETTTLIEPTILNKPRILNEAAKSDESTVSDEPADDRACETSEAFDSESGGKSLRRAMKHLSRLKLLIDGNEASDSKIT